MIHRLVARIYERLTGRSYWTESRPVDVRARQATPVDGDALAVRS